ncbi:MAG TPA: carboxypeptidase-like regulatory domain-containing protein [Acidobacteriaceae bacterium]
MRIRRFHSAMLALTLLVVGSLAFVGVRPAQAQNVYAAIHGTVTDSTGAIIPNASVTVVNTSTNITTKAVSDSRGYFILPQLQVGGPYTVTIEAAGFESFTQSNLNLQLNDNRDIDAKMAVGSSTTTVQVSASVLQVETSDSQLKQIVTTQQLEAVPLEGRDASGLQKLEPGVVEASDRFGGFSTDGSQTPQNSYQVNGIDINDYALQDEAISVNPDALQEENIIASTLNPEFSRNSGATVSQVVKGGTNSLHGDGFEYYRDTFLNAKPYFAQTVPQFHQNLYGGTLGGPVLPNKLFFFLGYQGLRNRTGAPTSSPTLNLENFSGDFSDDINYATEGANNVAGLTSNELPFAIPGTTCAPPMTWSDCFPTGTVNIAPADWNSIAASTTTKYIPKPNDGSFYDFNTADTDAADQGIIRADFTPTSRDAIWASSIFQSSPSVNSVAFGGGSFPGFGVKNSEHFKLFSVSYTHTFNATTLNELHGAYFRLNFPDLTPTSPATPSSYGFTGISAQETASAGFPYLSIGEFAVGNSYEGPQPRTDTNLSYGDNFTKIVGAHSLKIGASFEQFRVDNPFSYLNNGYFFFDGGTGGGGIYSSGDPNLDFELGIPDGYEQTSNGDINDVAAELYAFVQDSWKVSSDLTVNYGISWDAETPNQNAQFEHKGIVCWNNSSAVSKVFPGGPPGLSWPGDTGCNGAGGPTAHYNRFGPRVGFAWSPSGGPAGLVGAPGAHDFSIRGGFGIYYNRDQEEQSLQNLEDPPFLQISLGAGDVGGYPSFANPFEDVTGDPSVSEANRFPAAIPGAGDTNIDWAGLYYQLHLATFDSKKYTVPYGENFNLNIQRALPGGMILQVGYVGSLGHRLPSWYDGDSITPAGHAACLAGSVPAGFPAVYNCNSGLAGSIHTYFPQFTADPALDGPASAALMSSFPNGVPWYTSVAEQTTEGASNYNSLQVSLIKAASHGLYFSTAYTYSHALDDGSGYESSTGGGGENASGHVEIYTPGFTYLNYGNSDYDARNRFVSSYAYRVPVFSAIANNAILREAVSGWEVGGVTALQSGFPIGIQQGQTRSLWCDGSSYFGCGDVPETSSFHIKTFNPRKTQTLMVNGTAETGNFYFDPSSFSNEPIGTYGNVKRNFFHGPGFNYTNLQLSKNFAISKTNESRYVEVRIEAFNAFNHANFTAPGGNFSGGSTFGEVSAVVVTSDPNGDPSPARSYQLVGKLFF